MKRGKNKNLVAVRSAATPVVESLENRQLMSGSVITGATITDTTGNGVSRDDRRLGGVTVELFQDLNHNGKLDATDGPAVATTVSNKGGSFKFSNVQIGSYLLKEVAPANAVQTEPMLTNVYSVEVTKKKAYTGHKFYNYFKTFDRTQVTDVSYLINGTTRVSTLAGNVHEGDTVRVEFTLLSTQTVALVSYRTTNPNGTPLSDQRMYDKACATLKAGTYAMEVQVPKSYFQIDFVGGVPLDKFGLSSSTVNYTNQDRLISADMGGTHVLATGRGVATCVKTMNKKWHGVYEYVNDAFVQKK
jgi:uncharacterized protein (DUF2141 family)